MSATIACMLFSGGRGFQISPAGTMLPFFTYVALNFKTIILKQHMYNNKNTIHHKTNFVVSTTAVNIICIHSWNDMQQIQHCTKYRTVTDCYWTAIDSYRTATDCCYRLLLDYYRLLPSEGLCYHQRDHTMLCYHQRGHTMCITIRGAVHYHQRGCVNISVKLQKSNWIWGLGYALYSSVL